MPTTWNRSPEEFHKIYIANTDAFYRVGSFALSDELDKFVTRCALELWSKAGSIGQPAFFLYFFDDLQGRRSKG